MSAIYLNLQPQTQRVLGGQSGSIPEDVLNAEQNKQITMIVYRVLCSIPTIASGIVITTVCILGSPMAIIVFGGLCAPIFVLGSLCLVESICCSNGELAPYESPLSLYKMQQEAKFLTYTQIIQKHRDHRLHIISKKELAKKFKEEFENKSFNEIRKEYYSSLAPVTSDFVQQLRSPLFRPIMRKKWVEACSKLPFSSVMSQLVDYRNFLDRDFLSETEYQTLQEFQRVATRATILADQSQPLSHLSFTPSQSTQAAIDYFNNTVEVVNSASSLTKLAGEQLCEAIHKDFQAFVHSLA